MGQPGPGGVNVLGLDLSLSATGVALPDGSPDTVSPAVSGLPRLAFLRDYILATVETHGVDVVAVEGYAMGTARQSHSYAIGELGGVVRLALHEHGVVFVDIPPASMKKYATGRGNASKDEVFGEAIRRLGYAGKSKDEADALWLQAMTLDQYGRPVVRMPAANRAALTAVGWPALEAADVA